MHALGIQAIAPDNTDWISRKFRDLEHAMLGNMAASSAAMAAASAAASEAQSAANAALAATVAAVASKAETSNFSVTIAIASKASTSLTVPAGFTRALVSATSNLAFYNSDPTDTNGVRTYTFINGASAANPQGVDIPKQSFATVSSSYETVLTGLSGGATITAQAQAYSDFTLPADVGNAAGVYLTALFLR